MTTKAYRPFKPGDTIYAVGPGLGVYVKDVGRESAEVEVDGQSYVLSIYKIYEVDTVRESAVQMIGDARFAAAGRGEPVKLPCGCDDYGTGCQIPALHGSPS